MVQIKELYGGTLRSLPGLINSVFKLTQLPLSCHHYSCIHRQTKTVHIVFNMQIKIKKPPSTSPFILRD
ncbi:transposase [Candidatus Enterovibrio altilux]|uniref:transposase n=1 Tax=Candidatus Enterovibrio altilux TaxID=1927128 RepID=UPI001237AE17|nr:transposase [Candidatus Enterovibrio luxaltus]